jgi:hypothetical protein
VHVALISADSSRARDEGVKVVAQAPLGLTMAVNVSSLARSLGVAKATLITTCQSVDPCGGTQGVTDRNVTEVPFGPWSGLTEKVGSAAAPLRAIGRSTISKQTAKAMKV